MFNKEWFKSHQKIILRFVNTWIGRKLLGINNLYTVGNKKIYKIEPNAITWIHKINGNKIHFITQYRTFDVFSVKFMYLFVPIILPLHLWDILVANNLHLGWNLGFDIATFTASGGGQGRVRNNDATYATARNAASGNLVDSSVNRPANTLDTGQYYPTRGYAPFDTTTLSTTATIVSSANTFVRAVGGGGVGDTDSDSVSLVASTQASNTALALSDFSQIGSTKFATDITIASWSTAGNNDFQLNASGIANITKGGWSKFGWRTAKEIAGTAPSGNNTAPMVDNTNLLSVEFTLPSGFFEIL